MNAHDYHNKSKEELIELLLKKDRTLFEKEEEILSLKEKLTLYIGRQFSRKTEKTEELGRFDEAEIPQDIVPITDAEETLHIKEHSRKKPGRKPLPADLPREQRVYDLTEAEKRCVCGHPLRYIKDETC
jgi:transposase